VRYYRQGVDIASEGLALNVAATAASDRERRELASWQTKARERLRALDSTPASTAGSSRRSAPLAKASAQPADKPSAAKADAEEQKLRAAVEADILDHSPGVSWEDIAGCEDAKRCLQEMVVLPALRADLFTGLRAPARGLLLFGPPGTGKTLLAKACATESQATFFSISASSLTSKWVGEAEKLVRTLFTLAAERAPSVIFVDEIDSILSARSAGEHEASRRLKTEFLVCMDGLGSESEKQRVVVLAASNRPDELDDAVRRRLVRRIYVPLPDEAGRRALFARLLGGNAAFALPKREMEQLVALSEGYSGSDLHALCREAALAPLRELGDQLATVAASRVRPLQLRDFTAALGVIRPSVAPEQLKHLEDWDRQFGSRACA